MENTYIYISDGGQTMESEAYIYLVKGTSMQAFNVTKYFPVTLDGDFQPDWIGYVDFINQIATKHNVTKVHDSNVHSGDPLLNPLNVETQSLQSWCEETLENA